MTKIVYFDTNVFDHLIHNKHRVTKLDTDAVRRAVNAGLISIPLSIINLEEVFSALENYPREAEKTLSIISDLSSCHKMIKPQEKLLTDDLKSFVNFGAPESPFISDSVVGINIRELNSLKKRDEFLIIINKIKADKTDFKFENIKSRKEILEKAKELYFIPTFNQYWESLKYEFVKGLIERIGLIEKLKYRNINTLLDIKSIRLFVGWSISYIYGQTFGKKKPDLGDSRDMKHAVSASAADIFVTHDSDLAELMKRIPIENFEVCDLHELLDKI